MSSFRRVNDDRAGADALGILLPPGRRTFLILRPRALPWDLLLIQQAGTDKPGFRVVQRPAETALAQNVCQALEADSIAVQAIPAATGGSVLQLQIADLPFVVCPRQPGQPYRPAAFDSAAEAEEVGTALVSALRPQLDRARELYVNTSHFAR